ncbi:sigma-70 family RNA polymerase sigma factor [Paraflavitalea soli]|uniref:Sigma-70 family RNA polymerase sigma factor n=1 Tax=Paraflavitalea soli TaxID=2315862 RepID=A0A3B7MZM2_9BACT|nr:sigma-70 family RNA polymerase sigma factor [Paraflavitalea soli]AXY75731.1 sigma-70 family RNA polymerase sigma factor [Paraflavitalea soli]
MKHDQYAHITDQQLLERFYADHNNYWLGILFQRYTLLLLGVCMKYLKNEEEAKDSVQQIFLKAITELTKYRVDYFKSWFYMVAKNHCLMKIRDNPFRQTEIKEQMAITPEEDNGLRDHLEKDRQLELMEESLRELNNEQKLCVTLFYLEKRSYNEIAEHTGYSLPQVKSYIQNGKRNLKILLDKKLNS